jgi:protocatechuate 3,4-dioxygenase beta subunit
MSWHLAVVRWLAHAALGGSLFFAAGCLAAGACRQPVRRLRLLELALLGALLVPWASALPWLPHWSAGWLALAPAPADSPAPAVPSPPAGSAGPLPLAAAVPADALSPPPASPDRVPTDPAPAPAPPAAPAAPPPSLPELLLAAYGVVVAGLLAQGLLGLVRLAWLCRTAYPAPAAVRDLLDAIAGPAGARVRLLASDRIELPLMFAGWRPVIVLPGALCRSGDGPALRYCLAHEWSHVERRDAWRWYLATLAQLVFFWQPLFWWLRRQLRLCQDYLADARAAALAPEAEDYADYLVGLARRRLALPAVALGIGDRRSNLYRRILMLLHPRQPLERRCLPSWSLAAGLGALALLAALSAVRLDAGDTPPAPKEPPKEAKKEADKGQTLHYSGTVLDKDTHKPIAGAVVTVRRSLYGDPEVKQEDQLIQETTHTTDAQGKYRFTIPPEQSSKRYLYIELDVEHADYAPQKHFGYALSMILKNEKMGGRPFFESVELRPGKPITGTVQTADGKPAAGVKVLAYSRTDRKQDNFEYGSFADTRTDARGHFRLVLTTPGQAVFWILPEQFAPSTHAVLNNKRGDLGTFTLAPGIRVKGKVLDTKGKPVAGVNVNAEREGRAEELQNLPVADSVSRSAVTDARGEFALMPLPPGDYRIKPDDFPRESSSDKHVRRPVPDVFLPQKLTLKEGPDPEPVEIRAAPSVVIEAQYYDSKGKTTRGHSPFVFGQIDKAFWHSEAKADAAGKVTVRVPHGLEQARLQLSTNEHGSLRWRKANGQPLQNSHEIDLGTVNDDVKGIQIIRYVAPILVVGVKARDGKQPKDAAVTALYPEGKGPYQGRLIVRNGLHSDVSFEHQEDGRFRSSQLLPDEETTVTAQAPGYAPASVKVKLLEGEKKEVELMLDKEPEKKDKK